jgi:hypothetical protein
MQPINVPAIDPAAPAELKKRAAALAKDLDRFLERRGEHERLVKSLRDEPLDMAGVMGGESQLRESNADHLAAELHLRQQLQQLSVDHRAALVELRNEACAAFEQAKIDVEAMLLKMGYRKFVDGQCDRCAIQPGFILAHPSVRAPYLRADELQSQSHERGFEQRNGAAIAELERTIEASRERLAAV